MITPGKALGWTRGLRFRLALSYVIFFSVLLLLLGMLFRQILSETFRSQTENVLDEEWGAAKGYLRTGPEGPDWIFDEKDPDESFAVRRVQRVYMLADTQGQPLQYSEIYKSLGVDPPAEVRAVLQAGKPAIRVRTDPGGVPYMIRSGLWVDHDGHKYYLAIGRAIDYNDKVIRNFTWDYFAWVPLVIVLSGVLGWFLAGRALDPVNSVADVAHELRTPLTVVRGQLEVALFTAETVEQYRDAMADALEGVERLSNIVRA